MTTPLFYVDLAEDARDYRHTALEPGLPLLDRQGMNYQILRKWLGDYIAEPEWRNENVVAFYMAEEERGRLENVDCSTISRGELEKKFASDLDDIRAKIKKAKAESSTESMVLRILKKTIAEQTNDLENSDFDSFFFKCRAGDEEWRLVWCCGYQRADLEPLRPKLWKTPEGDFLGVRPPLGGKAKRRKRKGPLAILMSPPVLLLLLLLLGGFAWATWPRLVVTPTECTVPVGSRIEFKVTDTRWFFFKKDVTRRATLTSNNPSVLELESRGAVGNAKEEGAAAVSIQVNNLLAQAFIEVTPLQPPESLTLEPAADVKVAIGSTKQVKAIGHYKTGNVDLTNLVDWWEEPGEKRLLALNENKKGLIQGDSMGTTKLMARFPTPLDKEKDTYAEAAINVEVNKTKFTTLAVSLDPLKFAVGQSSQIEVKGIDENGEEHSLTGSSLVKYKIDPSTAATVDKGYLVGKAEESGTLKVSYDDLDKAIAFTVKGRVERRFDVQPKEYEAVEYEKIGLNVTGASDEKITAVSSDPEVVEVLSTTAENVGNEVWLAARSVGEATITVSQGNNSKPVAVTVTEGLIARMEFSPPVMNLHVGRPETANLVGTTEDGRKIHVVEDRLNWLKQPRVENVALDKTSLLLRPLAATDGAQDMEVRLADTGLRAEGTVEVRGDSLAIMESDTDAFGVHPPVPARGRYLTGDKSLEFVPDRGAVIGNVDPFSLLKPYENQTLVSLNGRDLTGFSEAELAEYLRLHPIVDGDVVATRGLDGVLATNMLGSGLGVVRDYKLLDVRSLNLAADSFNAELQLYLRLDGEYRLSDAAGKGLSEWKRIPAGSTPVMTSDKITRNAEDDYELYVERRIGDQIKRFQVPFKLAREMVRPVETVERVVEPVGDTLERAIGIPETTLKPQAPVREVVPRTEKKVIRETIRTRTVPRGSSSSSGSGTRKTSSTTSPASNSSAPPANTLASSPDSPAPNSPPAPAPAPAPDSKPEASPAPPDDAPAKPSPAPAKPSPAPAKPDPTPAKPSPAPAKPDPTPAKPSPAPAKPAPAKPSPDDADPDDSSPDDSPVSPATPVADAQPQGSGTRATPADAFGSDTRRPFAGGRAGMVPADQPASGTRGKLVRSAPPKKDKKDSGEAKEETGKTITGALKKYNRDWYGDKPK